MGLEAAAVERAATESAAARVGRGAPAVMTVVAVVLAALLGWRALGAAGVVVLGSTGLLAVAVGRRYASMRGAAAWAAAVVVEYGALVGMSMVLALVSPGPQPRWLYAAVLLVPAMAGSALLMAGPASRSGTVPAPGGSHAGIASAVVVAVLGVVVAIGARGPMYDVAWAMSGDARNHAQYVRMILADGGLTLDMLGASPAAANAVAAMVAGAGGHDSTGGGAVLGDARALAVIYALAAVAAAVLIAGAIIETLPRTVRDRRLPAPVVGVVVAAAAVVASPVVLGTALVDGFFSAYAVIPVALAAVVLALRAASTAEGHGLILPVVAGATGLTFATWPVVAAIPAVVLVVLVARSVQVWWQPTGRTADRLTWAGRVVALGVAVGALVVVAAAVVLYFPRLREVLSFTGSIRGPDTLLLPVMALLVLAIGLPARGGCRRQMVVPAAVLVTSGVVVLWLRTLSADGVPSWTYYATKTAWLTIAVLAWLPFVPVARWAARVSETAPGEVRATVGAVSGSVALLVVLGASTSAPEPIQLAARGWAAPSASTVQQLAEAADNDAPYLFWEFVHGSEDKLANFWAALDWATEPDGEWTDTHFTVWAYFQDESQVSQLCQMAETYPGIAVISRDPGLGAELDSQCPQADVALVAEP